MGKTELPELQCGDTILMSSRSFISTAIRWFTRAKGEPASRVSHVAGMISPELCSEALARNTIHKFKPHLSRQTIIIYRPKHLNFGHRIKIREYCEKVEDRWYGFWKLIPQAKDGLMMRLFGWDPKTRAANRQTSKYQICHEHWALALEYATGNNKVFGKAWWELTPDEMDDYCGTSPTEFELIFSHVKE